jgi:hypothetical protein
MEERPLWSRSLTCWSHGMRLLFIPLVAPFLNHGSGNRFRTHWKRAPSSIGEMCHSSAPPRNSSGEFRSRPPAIANYRHVEPRCRFTPFAIETSNAGFRRRSPDPSTKEYACLVEDQRTAVFYDGPNRHSPRPSTDRTTGSAVRNLHIPKMID